MGLFSKKDVPQPGARPEYIEVGQIVNTHGVRGEVLIPDRPEFVRSIDPAAGRMVVHLIEGM